MSVIKSVLGRNGSCTLRGRGVHMPFVVFLFSCLSRFFRPKDTIRGAYVFRKSLGFWRRTQRILAVARPRGEESFSFAP